MIEKTEGIVLRSRPFSRTSRMVTWLTPDFGRVTTVIKGACRPKSFFLGQTDLGYRCELLFYRREHAGAHIAREVFPLDCREALRGNWRASVAASYVCWLLSQVTEPMLASAELYGLLDRVLNTISGAPRGASLETILVDFEFLLLDLLGVSPNFSYCQDCTVGPDKRKSCRFLLSDGRLGCIHALSIHHESSDSVALTTSLVDALSSAQAAARTGPLNRLTVEPFDRSNPKLTNEAPEEQFNESPQHQRFNGSAVQRFNDASDADGEAAGSTAQPLNPRLAIGIRRFLGLFICHHLDVPIHPRASAYAWLDWDRYDKELISS